MHGLVIVSSLVKEMISFIETVVLHGSHADKFAYEVRVTSKLFAGFDREEASWNAGFGF
jgi:hypothetical protein